MANRKYTIGWDGSGVDEFIKGVEEYQRWLKEKTAELTQRLAELGATSASLGFARAIYTGPQDFEISVEQRSENCYAVVASGETVLVVEFGSGVTYGYGHPEASEHDMGPGTYPDGKGHWNDPRGWYLPKEKGGEHTFGNPPNMPMYGAVRTLEQELERIVKEVFSD